MQKVGHGVMPLNGIAPVGIDRDAHRLAGFGRAPLGKNRAVQKNIAALLRVPDLKLTDLGAIVSGNVEQSVIAYLSTHLGITRSLIEHDVDFLRILARQNRLYDCLRLKKILTEKPGRSDLQVVVFDADRFFFLGGTAASPLFLHQLLEAFRIDRKPALTRHQFREIERKTLAIVKSECESPAILRRFP